MRRVVEGFLFGAVLLDIAYWAIWFTHRSWIASQTTASYYAFEDAFPLADGWLGLTCVLALVALRRGSPTALLWLLCAGSAGIYLFCMDLLYDLENGIFGSGAGGLVEGCIVALTLAFSLTSLGWAWSAREELLRSGDSAERALAP